MKVRLRGQSIRFRLTRSEVTALGDGRLVSDRTVIGPAHDIALGLRTDADADRVTPRSENGLLVYALPAASVARLAGSDAVGFAADVEVANGLTLHVLIEKDFVCLDNPHHEPQDDAYPNPSLNCTPPASPAVISEP
ncbi:MAG TPA: hypothetical protein VF595_02625 [Tepidisphaeraceae bacterium]